MFQIKKRDGLARIGIIKTNHGHFTTPTLLPVINPNDMLISPSEMRDIFGTEMIITNSYVIYQTRREEALEKGVHGLLRYDGSVMTDSGSFQSYIYGNVEVSQNEILDFQRKIGSDFFTMLDVFSSPDAPLTQTEMDVEETIKRARDASEKYPDGLVLTVQGGKEMELRKRCAEAYKELKCSIIGIGGVVPIMERYEYPTIVDVVISVKMNISPAKPVHLFGNGHPMFFSVGVLLGCDIFDSAAYIKYAKDERMMFLDGTRHLEDLKYFPCACPVCSKNNPMDVIGMDETDKIKLLSMHNLYVSYGELRFIKESIHEGRMWEHTSKICVGHPRLRDALKEIVKYSDYIEKFTHTSKNFAMRYIVPEDIMRPEMHHYYRKLMEYTPQHKTCICMIVNNTYDAVKDEKVRKIIDEGCADFIMISPWGPVPAEFAQMYPSGQCEFPHSLEKDVEEYIARITNAFLKKYDNVIYMDDKIHEKINKCDKDAWEISMLRRVADYQFGMGAGDALISGDIELIKSKNTDRVRNVLRNKKHILSVKNDGKLSLKIRGAEILLKNMEYPHMRIVISDDAVPFVSEGRNVFVSTIVECDREIRPGDEVLIVDKDDQLVAVARAILSGREMKEFEKGMAAKVTEGRKCLKR